MAQDAGVRRSRAAVASQSEAAGDRRLGLDGLAQGAHHGADTHCGRSAGSGTASARNSSWSSLFAQQRGRPAPGASGWAREAAQDSSSTRVAQCPSRAGEVATQAERRALPRNDISRHTGTTECEDHAPSDWQQVRPANGGSHDAHRRRPATPRLPPRPRPRPGLPPAPGSPPALLPAALKRRVPKYADLAPLMQFKKPEFSRAARLRRASTIWDLRDMAKRRTPQAPFDYTDGAAEAEISLRRARQAFLDIEFRPGGPARRLQRRPQHRHPGRAVPRCRSGSRPPASPG